MATIQRNVKTFGTRSFVGEVAAAPSNYAPILSNEVDADLDTVYAAWNGGADSVNVKDGSITYAKLAPDAKLWQDTGTVLTPGANYTTRPVSVSGTNNPLQWGALTIKGRLNAHPTAGYNYISANALLNAGGTAWTQDAAGFSSWIMTLNTQMDSCLVSRMAPGGTTPTTLLTVDSNGRLVVNGAPDNQFQIGPGTMKGTLSAPSTGELYLLANNSFGPGDTTKASWHLLLNPTADIFQIYRRPPNTGGGAHSSLFAVVNTGDLIIAGNNATKNTGTVWVNPSDRRLKDGIADYPTGLAAIEQLQPRTFVFNGKGGSTAGMRGYGFIADEVESIMPETVGTRSGTLDPDDEDETDIQTLDQSNLILALVNATKELAGRVAALEGAAA
jgi:Chaperone of endosialidase